MNWVRVATAPNQSIGESWAELLREEGIPARVQPAGASVYIGIDFRPVPVMVSEDRLTDAHTLLAEFLDPSAFDEKEA